jgi:hypothetical protein
MISTVASSHGGPPAAPEVACEYGDAVTTGVPRRFVYGSAGLRPRSAWLFGPESTPAFRTDLAVDERAGVRLLEQRAVALWPLLPHAANIVKLRKQGPI